MGGPTACLVGPQRILLCKCIFCHGASEGHEHPKKRTFLKA